MGMGTGPLAACPGVGGVAWAAEMVKVRASSSQAVSIVREGVPACSYQAAKDARSAPLASAMAARKSSHVTAAPSWRAKYRSMPFRKPSTPRRVSYRRTTSAPFSYTVTV